MAEESLDLLDIVPVVQIQLQDSSYKDEDIQKLIAFAIVTIERYWNQGYQIDDLPHKATKVSPVPSYEYLILIAGLVWLKLYPYSDETIRGTQYTLADTVGNWRKDKNPFELEKELILSFKRGDISKSTVEAIIVNTNNLLSHPISEIRHRH